MSVLDSVDLHLVETVDEVNDFFRWLAERRPILGLDIETSGLSLAHDRIRMVQFGDGAAGWAIPYEEWRGVIRQALAEYDRPVVLQHAKFDAGFLTRDGLPFPWAKVHDTMLMAFLVNSQGPKSLKPAAALYVDPSAGAGQSDLKKTMAVNGWDWGTIPTDLPAYWGYAAADTVLTALLAEELWPRIQQYREAYDLELACERVLCGMEVRGMRLDVDYVKATARKMRAELSCAVDALPFNPFSGAQVTAALQAAGVELKKRTPGGAFSMDDEVLSALDNPLARDVLYCRSASKLLGAYFDNFLAAERDGLVHPHINQLQAKTGRMSVTDPALQTLPRTSLVRDAFIPRDGNQLVLADYDGQELRLIAHYSGDPAMLQAFAEGRDLHAETALATYGPGWTTGNRSTAKNGMYATAYGAEIDTLAATLHVDYAEAQHIREGLFEAYPGMARTMAAVTAAVRERANGSEWGFVTLADSRRLKVSASKAYSGFNYLIQGTGALVMKRALVDLDAAGLGEWLDLPVHDEVVFDIPEAEVEDALPVIRVAMRRDDFRVPLTVGTKVVDRWGAAYREDG